MRTASRGIAFLVTKLCGWILALFCVSALACEGPQNLPGQYIDVSFDRASSVLSNAQILKLANWSLDIRSRFNIVESLSVIGLAERSEQNPPQLAKDRAEAVSRSLAQLGIQSTKEDVSGQVYKPRDPPSAYDEGGRRVEVSLGPGCPNNCCSDNR